MNKGKVHASIVLIDCVSLSIYVIKCSEEMNISGMLKLNILNIHF